MNSTLYQALVSAANAYQKAQAKVNSWSIFYDEGEPTDFQGRIALRQLEEKKRKESQIARDLLDALLEATLNFVANYDPTDTAEPAESDGGS